jgi:hypothetical protein
LVRLGLFRRSEQDKKEFEQKKRNSVRSAKQRRRSLCPKYILI